VRATARLAEVARAVLVAILSDDVTWADAPRVVADVAGLLSFGKRASELKLSHRANGRDDVLEAWLEVCTEKISLLLQPRCRCEDSALAVLAFSKVVARFDARVPALGGGLLLERVGGKVRLETLRQRLNLVLGDTAHPVLPWRVRRGASLALALIVRNGRAPSHC